jgi:iron-sulfur cluster assembly protein
MLTVSELASTKIREVLEQSSRQEAALRIWVRGMGCSGPAYGLALEDTLRPDDQVEELSGLRFLVDPVSAPFLEGAEIDYVESLMGQGFQIVNPKYRSEGGGCGGSCSCGH